jgi:rod shape-determining protein MreD
MPQKGKKYFTLIINSFPVLLLFILVFTGFDLSIIYYDINISFNLIYILIFFWVLKKPETIGFGLIFLSGIINDVILNYPIGISSVNYLFICGFASFFRDRTLTPNLLYDWAFFFLTILIVNSINYILLTLIFDSNISYQTLISNTFFTTLAYPVFANIFNKINIYNLKEGNA